MTSNLIVLFICVFIGVLLIFHVFRYGGRTQKAVQEIIDKRNRQLEYCRKILETKDKVKYNGRECVVLKIQYLSEKISIQDIETSEYLYNVDFTDNRLEIIPKN